MVFGIRKFLRTVQRDVPSAMMPLVSSMQTVLELSAKQCEHYAEVGKLPGPVRAGLRVASAAIDRFSGVASDFTKGFAEGATDSSDGGEKERAAVARAAAGSDATPSRAHYRSKKPRSTPKPAADAAMPKPRN